MTDREALAAALGRWDDPFEEPEELLIFQAARAMLDLGGEAELLLVEAVTIDGGHHKQWFLEQLAGLFGVHLPDHEPGIEPALIEEGR